MSERDYLDYDDWLRDTGGDQNSSHPEEPQYPEDDEEPSDPNAWLYDQNATPPFAIPGQDWYWNGNQWTTRNTPKPPAAQNYDNIPTTYGGPTAPPGGGGGPTYNAPAYIDQGPFDPGPAFSFREFVAPDPNNILNDKSFQWRMDQGRKALEAGAAGRGLLRTGGTMKDLLAYGQNFASQEYSNIWNRSLQEYDTNRNNAADMWGKQYVQRKDVYGFGQQNTWHHNSFNQSNAQQEFQALYDVWAKNGDWLRDLGIAGLD